MYMFSRRSQIQFEDEDHAVYTSFRLLTTTLSSLRTTTCDTLIVPSEVGLESLTPGHDSVGLPTELNRSFEVGSLELGKCLNLLLPFQCLPSRHKLIYLKIFQLNYHHVYHFQCISKVYTHLM